MKRFMKRTDLTSLWEKDGDLKRMKAFFDRIQVDSEGNEQIKQSIKQKALEKIVKEEHKGLTPSSKEGLVQRLHARFVLSGIGRWKIGVSVVGLAILVIIGQGVINSSWNLFPRLGNTAESTQHSIDAAPQVTDSSGATNFGANQKTASSNSAGTPSAKGATIVPLPPGQTVVPPADEAVPRKITSRFDLNPRGSYHQ